MPGGWAVGKAFLLTVLASPRGFLAQTSFLLGFCLYFVLHIIFRPHHWHVVAHEFTHALWAKAFGGRIRSICSLPVQPALGKTRSG